MSGPFEITKGKKKQPFNILLYGQPGLGKTTFAASAPAPIVLGAEETGELDVSRFPQPKTFEEISAQLDHLIANKGLDFQTVVIDTIDSVESLVHRKLLASDPKSTGSMIAAHGGFGKALDMSVTELLGIRDKLKILRDTHGMNIILLAHAKKVQGSDLDLALVHDTYELNLHVKAQAVFVDWVSAVLFAKYKVQPMSGTNTDKVFATGEGERVLYTEKRPQHLAKNRFNLPYEMPLEFKAFKKAYDEFFEGKIDNDQTRQNIIGLCENIEDKERVNKILLSVEKAGEDSGKLQKILEKVKEVVG